MAVWSGIGDRVRHLRVALLVAAVVAVLGAVVSGLASGTDWSAGAIGFAAGVLLVAASYTLSTLAIAWADSINPQMVFGVGVTMYATKIGLLGILLVQVNDTAWTGKLPMAMGILAGVLAWTTTQIWWTVRTTHPYAQRA